MRIERLLADDIDDIDDVEEDDRLRMSAFDAKEPARLRIPTRRPDTFEIRGFDEWRQDELLIRGAYWLQMNVRYVSGEELADFQLHPYAKVLDFKNELTQAGLDEHWFDQHQIAIIFNFFFNKICFPKYFFGSISCRINTTIIRFSRLNS